MIIDSSALVALLRVEPSYEELKAKLETATEPIRIGTPNYLETSIVVDGKKDPVASRRLDETLALFDIETIAFTKEHARIAREAYRDFGRGSGHAAKLNFGDCMAYATAKLAGEPLLFVGDDFPHTDIEPA